MQLYLEIDDSQKLSTVGDLMNRMFSEQKISFTEVFVSYFLCINLMFDCRSPKSCCFKCHNLERNSRK